MSGVGGGSVPCYNPREGNKPMFNNPNLSDIHFLIGGKKIYGHKMVLSMASPVFESMFYGELEEQLKEIKIEGLSLVGFENALRYIYGFEIDFKLFDLYESFVAADRYKLYGFSEALTGYIKAKLNAENSCLIYDQLIKIGEREEISLADVRTIIAENSQKAFASEHFTQIDQETLISLLSLDELNIAEIDLLKAVSKWVDCKVQRQGLPMDDMNRQLAFEPIKRYISFTAFTPDQITACEAIKHLFPRKEIESFTQQVRQVDAPLTPQATSSKSSLKSLTPFEATTSDHQKFNLEFYEHLNVNQSFGGHKQTLATKNGSSEKSFCNCDKKIGSRCSDDDSCLNRSMAVECNSNNCNNLESCQNRRFTKRQYAKVEKFKSKTGWGLRCTENLTKGQFIIEYVGELIDKTEYEQRLDKLASRKATNFYFMSLDKTTVIDAGCKGNLARFANHSCEPNCSVERWIVDDYTRVGLFAIQDIEAYTELTFDYNYTYASTEKIKCLCGTAKCREFIGERRLSDRQKATEKRAFESSSETAGEQKEHSDVCFGCLNEDDTVTDNVLLMCDYDSCTHSWHPSCVGLDSIPSGDWICPVHDNFTLIPSKSGDMNKRSRYE